MAFLVGWAARGSSPLRNNGRASRLSRRRSPRVAKPRVSLRARADYEGVDQQDFRTPEFAVADSAVGADDGGIVERLPKKRFDQDVGEILAFGFPVLGGIIADPLMALVDTACCGKLGTAELAALGPVGNIFLFVVQVFGFLGIATTNLVASNAVVDDDDPETAALKRTRIAETLCHGLLLACALGTLIAVTLLAFAEPLLRLCGANDEILPHSLSYMSVRALGLPGIFVMTVAQGVCLGLQDAWSPLIIFVVAGVVNLFGDMFLIFKCGLGVRGAALATTLSTYAGALAFTLWLRRGKADKTADGGRQATLRWMGFPRRRALRSFFKVGNALLVRQVATMTAYGALTVFATLKGTVTLATHQIALQLFWFLSFFGEPLSVCGQSMIARQLRRPARLVTLSRKLLELAVVIGLGVCVPLLSFHLVGGGLFTSDARVLAGLRRVLLPSMIAEVLCAVTVALDGISIGAGDFEHLPLTSIIALFGTIISLLITDALGLRVVGVWIGMCSFFAGRFGRHVFRAWRLHAKYGQWPVPITARESPP